MIFFSFICVNINYMKKLVIILSFLMIFGCLSKEDYIPIVSVDERIDLNLPEFAQLNISGEAIFIEGGVKGIIIYNSGANDYKAYDRSCSYEPSLECARIDSIYSSVAFCQCCSSMFLLNQNGTAGNSPAIIALTKYSCQLDNSTNMLHIFNY